MEDELDIDLRQYIDVLARRWRLIVTLAVLAAIAAGAFALTSKPSYRATAGVVIVKTKTDLEFDSRFKTLSDATTISTAAAQAEARRNALLGLVQNGAIASQVIAELDTQLKEDERNPAVLLNRVDAVLVERSDLIQIKVTDADPEKAAAIANAWAREYERSINTLYGETPADYSQSIEMEFGRARQDYEQAQAALEAFIADNQIDQLGRQISETQQTVEIVQQQRLSALSAVVQKRLSLDTAQIHRYLNAQNTAAATVFDKQVEAEENLMASYYATQGELERLLEEARGLRAQAAQGGQSSAGSNSLAILLLKAQAFTSAGGLPSTLELSLGDMGGLQQDTAGQLADLDAMISVLEQRQKQVGTEIARRSQAMLKAGGMDIPALDGQNNPLRQAALDKMTGLFDLQGLQDLVPQTEQTPLAQLIDQYSAQLAQARSALEKEQAAEKQLAQERDLAWETYTTLARKQSEVSIASAVTDSEVRFAAPAVPPKKPVSSRTRDILIAGALGLALGIFAAFGAEYLLGPQPPQTLLGKPGWLWNRAFRWMMSEGAGLPALQDRTK